MVFARAPAARRPDNRDRRRFPLRHAVGTLVCMLPPLLLALLLAALFHVLTHLASDIGRASADRDWRLVGLLASTFVALSGSWLGLFFAVVRWAGG